MQKKKKTTTTTTSENTIGFFCFSFNKKIILQSKPLGNTDNVFLHNVISQKRREN